MDPIMARKPAGTRKRPRKRKRYCVISRNFDTFVCDLSLNEAKAMKASIPSARITFAPRLLRPPGR